MHNSVILYSRIFLNITLFHAIYLLGSGNVWSLDRGEVLSAMPPVLDQKGKQ